jgi:hypothetical protein
MNAGSVSANRCVTRLHHFFDWLADRDEHLFPPEWKNPIGKVKVHKENNPDGTESDMAIPPIPDCPLVFPGGGAFLEFPVVAGDEVLLIFASRLSDNWWA